MRCRGEEALLRGTAVKSPVCPISNGRQSQAWDQTLKLNGVIKDCITLKLDGCTTDGAIQVFGGNFLSEQKPVLPIEVRDREMLLWMMQGANGIHIYVASGVCYFNALDQKRALGQVATVTGARRCSSGASATRGLK
ncbi:hypothetical protein DOQ73_23795 [Salmonella enterica subsp. enterica]|nr:hypothetical protein [Salmonella enterica subsp. enterica serovar Javiana]